jgi:TetR/AcrR family transcriptional regulator
MPAEQRRPLVLAAAAEAFAEGGYAGTTTDDIARVAGVSQPYVVRMFGTKQALFLAAHHETMSRIEDGFRAAVTPPGDNPMGALGCAYNDLIADRTLVRVMQHGFVAASDPALGPAMRARMLSIYRLVRELTGCSAQEASDFLARGMLINTLVSLDLPQHLDEDPTAAELMGCILS